MLPDELENQCHLNNIHGIFLMPSCCNPTTIMISNTRKKELTKVIKKFKLILIEDDIHAFLTASIITDYRQSMFQLLPEQTIYICSTSKSICSGLRVAYMVFGDMFKGKILKGIFTEYFPQVPHIGHPLSFYRWLPILGNKNIQELETNLLHKGIRVLHSDRFLSGSNMPDKFLRIALASTNSLNELETGLKILRTQLT